MLTPLALERAAEALATACNGGIWARDYTDGQKELWRNRVLKAMNIGETP